MIDRYTYANAIVAYTCREQCPESIVLRLDKDYSRISNLSDHCYSRHDATTWEMLDSLEPEAQAVYFALVAKHESPESAEALASDYARIQDPGGVTITVANTEDDPFEIMFDISDEGDSGEGIADAWADRHGSLMGGTWECPDRDPSFVYDTGFFCAGCFDELEREGYCLDLSGWSDPEEEDYTIARHASACLKCQGDFRQAEKHLADGPLFSSIYLDPTVA